MTFLIDFLFLLFDKFFFSLFSGISDPLVILMNASLCFSNTKKFLLEIRRIEQEQENENNLKNENKKTVGSKTLDSGRQLANNQAFSATVALLKVCMEFKIQDPSF